MSVFRKMLIFRAKNDINGALKCPVLSIHVRRCPPYVRTENPLSGKCVWDAWVFVTWVRVFCAPRLSKSGQ